MKIHPPKPFPASLRGAAALGAAALALLGVPAHAQIDATNWGSVTSPVYGANQAGTYAGAEPFAGPNQFGSYFAGVLPNGRKVIPAGVSVQTGMNPLGAALTPDGQYLITSNDDERDGNFASLQNPANTGGYSLSVIRTSDMTQVSQITTTNKLFVGLQVKGTGPYTVYASGGGDNSIKLFSVSAVGTITAGTPASIAISPILPNNQGYVSNYTPSFTTMSSPTGYSGSGAKTTFPAGSALSPNGRYLYVACNGDNSLAVVDTTTNAVVRRVPVGFFPYGVSVSRDGTKVLVSNIGIMPYKFLPTGFPGSTGALGYSGASLTSLARVSPPATRSAPGAPDVTDGLFFVPPTSATGTNPQTSSVSVVSVPNGDATQAALLGSVYQGHALDALYNVGDTHPSATATVKRGLVEVQYVAKANSDSLGLIQVSNNRRLPDFDLSPLHITLGDGHQIHGAYPNALAVSPDNGRLYVAEAGLNSVAVLDTTNPTQPRLLGRLPTGWYPTALSLSADGRYLYVVNAKGIGEDINPATTGNPTATGLASFIGVDSNYIFGSVQKVDLTTTPVDNSTVATLNYAVNPPTDTSIVPVGGAASTKIKHVIFILHENKTFDSMLGSQSGHFGVYASTTYNGSTGPSSGNAYTDAQFNSVAVNTQALANAFATGVNYYSDAEESDAGHQFAASGTATDYTEKTLLVKSGRGLLVNKNFEPEDYPEGGYIFNNAARNGVSFKDYGAMIRIVGTDTGTSRPTTINDPNSGNAGFPTTPESTTAPVSEVANSDVSTQTNGLGQSYFMNMPILSILGTKNASGEPRLDRNYPGYNFNISDQRRAKEFIADFDRMVRTGTLPTYLYIYQPNDHTGGIQATNVPQTAAEEVADGDVGLGMVVQHLMSSPIYYNPNDGTGSAIFITYDDAQSTRDHIHPHRTPLVVVSPYAKPGFLGTRHYVTASIVKTEELLLGLPPNNYGDLFATDMRDLFQPTPNGITANQIAFNTTSTYVATAEGRRVWKLASKLDTSGPDRDSRRLGALARLSMKADDLHHAAAKKHHLQAAPYKATQARVYQLALRLVAGPAPRDSDD